MNKISYLSFVYGLGLSLALPVHAASIHCTSVKVQVDYSLEGKKVVSMVSNANDDFVVGKVDFGCYDTGAGEQTGFINRLYVSEVCRGTGIGKALFRWAIDDLKDMCETREVRWEAYPFEVPYRRDMDKSALDKRHEATQQLERFYVKLGGKVTGYELIDKKKVKVYFKFMTK